MGKEKDLSVCLFYPVPYALYYGTWVMASGMRFVLYSEGSLEAQP